MSNLVKILSLDGGGNGGAVPALPLSRIEELTQRPIASLFDLIAGTSTSGILALGLTIPAAPGCPLYSAKRLCDMYQRDFPRILTRSPWRRNRIDEVLHSYFGEARLADAVKDVLIPSYEVERGFPFFFKSSVARTRSDYDFPMRDVARAASAAPNYFKPVRLQSDTNSDRYALINAGAFASNPAACALIEACTMYPDADGYLLVSLGSGQPDRAVNGLNSTVDYQLRKLLPELPGQSRRYYRFETEVLAGDMDKLCAELVN
jgi:patatin-like phospholipase/acyl hydrolase